MCAWQRDNLSKKRNKKVCGESVQSSFLAVAWRHKGTAGEYQGVSEYAVKGRMPGRGNRVFSFIGIGNHWREKVVYFYFYFLMNTAPM